MEAKKKLVWCCLWNETKTHTPYRNVMRSHDDQDIGQFSVLDDLFREADIQDGDEVEIIVKKTGNRPFGDKAIVYVKPHTYERET